jgi:diadenosine tetraphosphate (Ap4A) HIT family hydrolase
MQTAHHLLGGDLVPQDSSATSATCPLCQRVAQFASRDNPQLIHEFEHSYLLVGDHQFHRGYCVLVFKQHVRELHDLEPALQSALFSELISATQAIARSFQPWKMNHSCYGNQVPHIHWHIIPRYDSEPDHLNPPWLHAGEFKQHEIDAEQAREIAQRIRRNL